MLNQDNELVSSLSSDDLHMLTQALQARDQGVAELQKAVDVILGIIAKKYKFDKDTKLELDGHIIRANAKKSEKSA